MTKIFSVINQKGGVGKTTSTINIASSLAAFNHKVLLVDLDPQGHSTIGIGIDDSYKKTTYDALLNPQESSSFMLKTFLPSLDILPSNQNLSGAEIELVPLEKREYRLKEALSFRHKYDYIFIDCPPSLGLLTVNALVASPFVLIPVQCEFYALDGLSHLVKTMKMIKKLYNPTLELWGLLLTMYDSRSLHNKQVVEEVKNVLGKKVFLPPIPRNISVSESASFGKPVVFYDSKCGASKAYLEISKNFF